MVSVLIVAVAVGIFFATPLRTLLTGPDDVLDPDDGADVAESEADAEPAPVTDPPPPDGPWSTADPAPDPNWPRT
jgi:hypothetical protein